MKRIMLILVLCVFLLPAFTSAHIWDGPIPSDEKERKEYHKQAAANFASYKYAGIINVTETVGKNRALELVVARSSPIDINAINIKQITGPSSSAHGGVAYVKDVRVAHWNGSNWVEIPSQTGNVVVYPNFTASFDVYFLANVTANSMETYYIFYGAEDPAAIENPITLYRTDLKYTETATGGVSVQNSYYNVTVDASFGGWMTKFSVIEGSGTMYPHGDCGGAFLYTGAEWYSQSWNTLSCQYRILAEGPIVVQAKFWGPVADMGGEDMGIMDYESTWTFSAYSPRIVLLQNLSLKTSITLNDFRPVQWKVSSFNWYDFYVLRADGSLYRDCVVPSIIPFVPFEFNNAYWEVDVTRNNLTDAVAIIPEMPVFDIVKERWFNIGCMDYVLDTHNPDTRTEDFGPGTYVNPLYFYIYIQNAETLTADNCAKVKEYEILSKQPLRISADIPPVFVRNIQLFNVTWEGETYYVKTFSNSIITNLNFSQPYKQISFNVTGPDGIAGFCDISIPKTLLRANENHPWVVLLDGNPTDYTKVENDTHTSIYLTYDQGTHLIIIRGTWVVPESPTRILPLLMIATLVAAIIGAAIIGKMILSRRKPFRQP